MTCFLSRCSYVAEKLLHHESFKLCFKLLFNLPSLPPSFLPLRSAQYVSVSYQDWEGIEQNHSREEAKAEVEVF